MDMLLDNLEELLAKNEDEHLEFKEAREDLAMDWNLAPRASTIETDRPA